MLEDMIRHLKADALLRGHFDVAKKGKGAYLIFNNEDKDKGRMGDGLRSTARISENPQLYEINFVLVVALRIAKFLGLVSQKHFQHIKVIHTNTFDVHKA